MADQFQDEFKINIIADARQVDAKIQETNQKLVGFVTQANQKAQVRLRMTIADLDSKIADARKRLSALRKDGDKLGEIKARLEIKGLQENKTRASKLLRDLQADAEKTTKSFFSLNGIVKDALKAFGGFFIIREFSRALKSTFDAAVSFESAFAGVKKTVDATKEEFAVLEQEFRDLAKTIPLPVEGLARIGELAGQLGIAKDDIIDFTRTIAAIGVTTNLTEEEAATSFARIANIFQLPVKDVENLASAVVDLGNNFATTEREIVDFATRIAGAGKVVGLSTSDIAALGTAFSSVGVEAEAGGTAVQKTLISINDAVASGGAELKKFSDIAGLSAQDFANLWKTTPIRAFEAFVKGLGRSGDQASAVLEDLVAGDVRLKRAFLSLAQSGDLLTNTINTATDAFAANTALQTEAEKRYETTESQLQAIANRWNDIKISIGNFLKTVAVPVLDFFVTLVEALGGADNNLRTLANSIKAAGIALATYFSVKILRSAALGVRALAAELLTLEVGMARASTATKAMAVVGGVASRGFGLLTGAIAALSSPVVFATTAIATMVLGWLDAKKRAEELRVATEELKTSLADIANTPSLANTVKEFERLIEVARGSSDDIKSAQKALASFSEVTQKNQQFGNNLDVLRQSAEDLLYSFGATTQKVEEVTASLDFFNKKTLPTAEDMRVLQEELSKLSQIELTPTARIFAKDVDDMVAKNIELAEAVRIATDKQKIQFERNGQNVEKMTAEIKNQYIAQIADSEDLGAAAAKAYELEFNNQQTREALSLATGELTDEMIAVQLAAAVKSGKNGEAAGLLWARGIIDNQNEFEAIRNASNLGAAVQGAFDQKRGEIAKSGSNTGAGLVLGIINGIKEKSPGLVKIINSLLKSLGAITGVGDFLKDKLGFDIIGGLTQKVDKFKDSYEGFLEAVNSPGSDTFKESVGGGSKALDEAEKQAKEAEKAMDDYSKSIDDVNKQSEKLRDDIVEFYGDIIDKIESAVEKQRELQNELSSFKGEQLTDFAKDTAARDVDLAKQEADLREEIKQTKLEETDSSDEQIRQTQELKKLEQELNDVLKERKEIQKFIKDLQNEGSDVSKGLVESFNEAQRRSGLSEFEQEKLALEDRIKAKETEVQQEIDKQEKIIQVQKQFLQLQNANDAESIKKRNDLLKLASEASLLTEEERQKKLEEIGFEGLTRDQQFELLKQAQTAAALKNEFDQVSNQQQELFQVKDQYFKMAEESHNASTDAMIAKTQELIALIRRAQIEQQTLNSLRNVSSNTGSTVQNINVTNNNSGSIDLAAALNSLINKIK